MCGASAREHEDRGRRMSRKLIWALRFTVERKRSQARRRSRSESRGVTCSRLAVRSEMLQPKSGAPQTCLQQDCLRKGKLLPCSPLLIKAAGRPLRVLADPPGLQSRPPPLSEAGVRQEPRP